VALDLAHLVLGLRLRLTHDLRDQALACLTGGQARDALELDELALLELGELGALLVELGLAGDERGVALLEDGHLTIERLLPVKESALGALERGALLTRLFLGGTTEVERLVLAFEDDLLLLGAGLGHEAGPVLFRVLHGVGGDDAPRDESDGDSDDGGEHRHHGEYDDVRHYGSLVLWSPDGRYRVRGAGASVDRSRWAVAQRWECSARSNPPAVRAPGPRLAEEAPHERHVLEIARQEVLQHDSLCPLPLEGADALDRLVRGAHDPAPAPLGEPAVALGIVPAQC
jgi:hypothetical protein